MLTAVVAALSIALAPAPGPRCPDCGERPRPAAGAPGNQKYRSFVTLW